MRLILYNSINIGFKVYLYIYAECTRARVQVAGILARMKNAIKIIVSKNRTVRLIELLTATLKWIRAEGRGLNSSLVEFQFLFLSWILHVTLDHWRYGHLSPRHVPHLRFPPRNNFHRSKVISLWINVIINEDEEVARDFAIISLW